MPQALAMEHYRLLWFVERGSDCSLAEAGRGLWRLRRRVHKFPSKTGSNASWSTDTHLEDGLSALRPTVLSAKDHSMSGSQRKPTDSIWPTGLSPRTARPPRPDASKQPDQFRSLNASLLYCPSCRVATPTRERLLLVLPTGNLYEYLCRHCGTSTGSKTDNQ